MVLEIIGFCVDNDIPDPLFTHIIYGFRLKRVKTGFDTHMLIYIYYPLYTKVEYYQLFTMNMVNHLLKSSHFVRLFP